MADPQFDWWKAALAGNMGNISDGDPHSGYYRNRNIPHAYWKDATGKQFCEINGKMLDMLNNEQRDRALTAWPFAAAQPVSYAYYKQWKATGTWPDQDQQVTETLAKDSKLDPESFEGMEQQINVLASEADRLIRKGAAKTKTEADRAADISTRLAELLTKAETKRKAESDPLRVKYLAAIEKWRPMTEAAAIYKRMKAAIITPFINAENARLQREHDAAVAKRLEEQQAAAKVEETHAAQVQAANDALDLGEVPPEITAMPVVETPKPAPIPKLETVMVGTRGRKISARTVTTAVIEDYAKALDHLKDHEDVKAIVQELATKFAKIGTAIPGCRIEKGSTAA